MKTHSTILFMLIGFLQCIVAQKKDTITYDVVVVGSYEPKLQDFPKKSFTPTILVDSIKKPSFQYNIFSKAIPLGIELMPIKASQVKGDLFQELKNNYLRAGIGSRTQFTGDLYVVTGRNKEKTVGLEAHHNSITGKIKGVGYPGRSMSNVEGFYYRYWSQWTLKANASYDYYRLHWYGYDINLAGDSINKKTTLQFYHQPQLNLQFYRTTLDSMAWQWNFVLTGYAFLDKFHHNEYGVFPATNIRKKINLINDLKDENVQFNINGSIWSDQFEEKKQTNGIVEVVPAYEFNAGPLIIKALLNTSLQIDSIGDVYFFPGGYLRVNLFPNVISIYGGVDGNLSFASKYTLFNENPFIHSKPALKFMKTKNHLYGGIIGNIASKWNYQILVQNKLIQNYAFFIQADTASINNTFAVRYDTLNWLQVLFEQQIEFLPRLKAGITAIFNEAQPVNEDKAWYIPRWQIDGFVQYNLQNKIMLTPQVSYLSKRYALYYNPTPFTETLKDIINLNLLLEYIYSKNLSFYLNFYNLLNQKYYLWYNYPMYGFSLLGGLKLGF